MHLGTISDSKILKKGVQIGPKIKRGPSIQEGYSSHHMASADRHFLSVVWPKFSAQPRDFLIEIKPTFFYFLEIMMRSNSYLIPFSIPISINRGNK